MVRGRCYFRLHSLYNEPFSIAADMQGSRKLTCFSTLIQRRGLLPI